MKNRSLPLTAFMILLLTLGAVSIVLLSERAEHLVLFFLIPVMFAIGVTPMIVKIVRGDFDLFEVTVPYFFFFFMFFGVGALFTILMHGVAYDRSVLDYIDLAVAYSTLGFACAFLGYYLAGKVVKPNMDGPGATPGWVLLAVLYTVGYVGLLLTAGSDAKRLTANAVITGLTSFITQLAFLTTLTTFYVIYLLMAKRADRGIKLLMYGWIIPTTIVVLFLKFGNKTALITTVGLAYIAFWYAKHRVPWKSLLAFAFIIMFIVFPIYYGYRNVSGRYYSQTYRMERTVENLGKQKTSVYAQTAFESVAKRFAIINSTAVILRDCGTRVEYQNGKTLWLGVLSVAIPRFLWPDKPTTNIGQWFGKTFHVTGFGNNSHISLSMVGELYWNFQVAGIIIGMLLFGVWMRILYRRFGMNPGGNSFRLAIYVVLMTTTVTGSEGAIGGLEGALIKQLFICVAIEKGSLLMQRMAERRSGGMVIAAQPLPLR